MAKEPIKTALHHWWPRTLAEHWRAPDGMVPVIRSDGTITRAPPGKFGGITNAHHMKMGGPWDSTFEPIFDQADSEMHDFVNWLFTLDTARAGSRHSMLKRVLAQPLAPERQKQIARVTASLLSRSPRIRNDIRITTEHYRGKFGLEDQSAGKTLIALNQQHLYDAYRKHLERVGRWAILFTDNIEFIAGDGFFHNFPASPNTLHSGRKFVLPILPTVAIIYMAPMSYPSEPKLVTLRVDDAEAGALNDIVQVYACDWLFFRTDEPLLSEAYRIRQFRQFRYHHHEWLDGLLDDLSQFTTWGPGGTPEIARRTPYGDSIRDARMLDRFRGPSQ